MSQFSLTVIVDGHAERARLYPVFLYFNGTCQLGFLVIYASGILECQSQQYDIDGIRSLIEKGFLRTSPDEGDQLLIPDIASMEVRSVIPVVDAEDLLREIPDIVRELNGEPTTSDVCRAAYKNYLQSPTEANRLRLKEAYEKVPRHLDCWLLGFDEKDIPIRKAIYGNDPKG